MAGVGATADCFGCASGLGLRTVYVAGEGAGTSGVVVATNKRFGKVMTGRTTPGTTMMVEVAAEVAEGVVGVHAVVGRSETTNAKAIATNTPRYGLNRSIYPHANAKMVFSLRSGISLMVEHQFSKLRTGVRFSYPAQ